MRNEPLVKVTQVQGTSDTHPLLAPDDERAIYVRVLENPTCRWTTPSSSMRRAALVGAPWWAQRY